MPVKVSAKVSGVEVSSPVKLRIGDSTVLLAQDGATPPQPAAGKWHKDGVVLKSADNPLNVIMTASGSEAGTYSFKDVGGGAGPAMQLERTIAIKAQISDKSNTRAVGSPLSLNTGDIVELTADYGTPTPPTSAATGEWFRNDAPPAIGKGPILRLTLSSKADELGSYTFVDQSVKSAPVKLESAQVTIKVSARVGPDEKTSPVKLKVGEIVKFKAIDQASSAASPKGRWEKDGVPVANAVAQPALDVTLSVDGPELGSYRFKPENGPPSNAITLEAGDESLLTKAIKSGLPSLGVILLYGLASIFILTGSIGKRFEWGVWDGASHSESRSWIFATLTIGVVLALVQFAGKAVNGKGLAALVVGQDQRASTSKVQFVLWTFLIGYALAYIAGFTSMTAGTFECPEGTTNPTNCVPPELWPTYLLLLGAPAAAAVVSKGVISAKVQSGVVQKSTAGSTSIADLTNNDAGNPDLIDIQYLLFNLIAFGYVAATFVDHHTLPAIPDILLGLTSAAAGTYVLNKALQSNPPVITSVVPSAIAPGALVTVRGQNLLVKGSDGKAPQVLEAKVGGVLTNATPHPTDEDALNLVAPPGMNANESNLKIVTATHIETVGFPIVIAALTVVGWLEATLPPKTGRTGTKIRVIGLPPATTVAGEGLTVTVGGLSTNGRIEGDDVISFDLPEVSTENVVVKVGFRGQISGEVTLPLAP